MARPTGTRRIRFAAAPGPGGTGPLLSGRLRLPAGPPTGAAVLSHPHPAFGGHMDVWLLPRIAEVLAGRGWAVLRYDVRGVGGSQAGTGSWDGGAERHDLAGAVARVRREVAEDSPVALVGWSFGALLGLLHGPDEPAVTDWVGIAPPTRPVPGVPMVLPDPAAVARWPARRWVLVGEHDQHFPPATTGVLAPHRVHVVAGADHFLFDRDDEVAALVAQCLEASEEVPVRGRYVVRISPADVGERVSVRSRIPAGPGQPSTTDTLGHLRAWDDGVLVIERRDGSIAEVREDDLLAGRRVPPPPIRRAGG